MSELDQIVEQLKRLNEAFEHHNDILLSHFIATGEIEMEGVDFGVCGMDS